MDLNERQTEQLKALINVAPERYRAVITPNYEYSEKLNKRESFLVTGGVGVGKTKLLVDVLTGYIFNKDFANNSYADPTEDVYKYRFYTVADVLRNIKLEWDNPHGTSIVDRLINTPCLFLDDLGSEKASEWVKEQLYIILNERYVHVRPVFITTNLTIEEIANNYGDRFASRLVEMCTIVKMQGEDRRIKKK